MTVARVNEVTLHHNFFQVTFGQGVETVSLEQVELVNLRWVSTLEKKISDVKPPCSRLDGQDSSTKVTITSP